MTYGVIDVGSNTIRLCIYDVEDGRIIPLFSTKNTAGLIDYVNDGELSKKGIRKACSRAGRIQRNREKSRHRPPLRLCHGVLEEHFQQPRGREKDSRDQPD